MMEGVLQALVIPLAMGAFSKEFYGEELLQAWASIERTFFRLTKNARCCTEVEGFTLTIKDMERSREKNTRRELSYMNEGRMSYKLGCVWYADGTERNGTGRDGTGRNGTGRDGTKV
ncbi:hypothetical protein ACFX1X_002221 [Malus domestica]